jgi:hypothetical protein
VPNADNAAWDFSTPMTLTTAVDDGPTVRLTYEGQWVCRPFPPHTCAEIRSSGRMAHAHLGRLLREVIAILERTPRRTKRPVRRGYVPAAQTE